MSRVRQPSPARLKRWGRCRICEKFTQLTKEHVPPKSAFNDRSYLEYYSTEIREANLRQWQTREVNSSGLFVFSLCERCNNKSGRQYGGSYLDFVKGLVEIASPDNAKKDVQLGKFTSRGLFLRQFTHGTFAEYKQHILWFEGEKLRDVQMFLEEQIASKTLN